MSKKRRTVATTSDEAMCFRYEIWHIRQAAEDLQKMPVKELAERSRILDSKIAQLSQRIEKVFGALADEVKVR